MLQDNRKLLFFSTDHYPVKLGFGQDFLAKRG